VPEQGFSSWSKDTVFYKCNDQKVSGFSVYYKSSEGYSGLDRFDLLVLFHDGIAWEVHFTVNVASRSSVEEPPPENKPAPKAQMPSPTTAASANLKYALECGAAKSTPPENDPDPIYKTKIAATDKVIYVVHYAASGETYIRNEQYRDQKFWAQKKIDNWSGVSIKRPDRTMVGTIRMDKGDQWVEYTEKLFRGRKLEATSVSVCRPIPGSAMTEGR
jgi:hypothetical protein